MMIRSLPLLSVVVALTVVPLSDGVEATESRELRFPPLEDGRLVLSVDTHTQRLLGRTRLAHGTGLGSQQGSARCHGDHRAPRVSAQPR